MHVISRKALTDFAAKHADATAPLDTWFRTAEAASWASIVDLRVVYPSADAVGDLTVINIKGNSYRLVLKIYYGDKVILVRNVLTHAEYDKGDWKK